LNTIPLVTIVMATYNGKRFLKESVESCLTQSFKSIELIVVVDGSTDETHEYLKSIQDGRLILIVQENQGHSNALNHGFEKARGKYWTWTSDDNLFMPNAVEIMVAVLESHPNFPIVKAGYFKIDENGKITGKSTYTFTCFLYTAEGARKAGPYRHEYREVNDIDFFMRFLYLAGPVYQLNEYLYKFRFHANSQTTKLSGKREFTSLRMHYDLVTRGFEKLDLKKFFFEQASRAAIYKDSETLEKILQFAIEKNMTFQNELQKQIVYLKTKHGWLFNRLKKAIWSRWFGCNLFIRRIFNLGYVSSVNKEGR